MSYYYNIIFSQNSTTRSHPKTIDSYGPTKYSCVYSFIYKLDYDAHIILLLTKIGKNSLIFSLGDLTFLIT